MKRVRSLLLLEAVLWLSASCLVGCVSINTALYPRSNYPPSDPSRVQILHSFPPDRDSYEIIGEVSVGETMDEYDSMFNDRLRKKVALSGGDAVVLGRDLERMVGFTTPGQSSTTGSSFGTASGSVVGQSFIGSGVTNSNSQTVYTPPTTVALGSYSGKGYILKYK